MSTMVIERPPQSNYGAVELKKFISANTLRAFIITSIAVIVLLFLYIILKEVTAEEPREFVPPPVSTVSLIPPAPMEDAEQVEEELAPPPPPEEIIIGTASRAGAPVPVPAAELDQDLAEFADLDEMEDADVIAADSIGEDLDFSLEEEEPIEVAKVEDVKKEELPPRDKFIPVEVKAQTDMNVLKQSITYPEMAKKANIEGSVYISVWIDKNGKPQKPKVLKSDSKMLEEEAIKAVMNAVWTPAVQNNRTVGMWVTIPISFKLSH